MTGDAADRAALRQLLVLKQHQHNGRRVPHKPLLVLLALGRLKDTGSSALAWTEAGPRLSAMLAEFGPTSTTAPRKPLPTHSPDSAPMGSGLWTVMCQWTASGH